MVDDVVKWFESAKAKGEPVAGQRIRDLVTVNGVRVTVEDGTWGLVRASSNKPELVVVVESPASEARMREMFHAVDAVLRTHPKWANTIRRFNRGSSAQRSGCALPPPVSAANGGEGWGGGLLLLLIAPSQFRPHPRPLPARCARGRGDRTATFNSPATASAKPAQPDHSPGR